MYQFTNYLLLKTRFPSTFAHFLHIYSYITYTCLCLYVCVILQLQGEETHLLQGSPPEQTDHISKERPFIFPHTRSRPPLLHTMPTLPEEEEDSPEELDSSSSSPSTVSAHFL